MLTTVLGGRVDHEPVDAGQAVAPDLDAGVESAEELPVGVPDLLHAGVVRIERRQHLVVRRLLGEQEAPATFTSGRLSLCVVDALAQRRRTRLLLGARRHRVTADVHDRALEVEIGIRLGQGAGAGERPDEDAIAGRAARARRWPPRQRPTTGRALSHRSRRRGALRCDGWPHREPRLAVEALTDGVELLHLDVLRRAGQRGLREGVELRRVEDVVREEGVLVRREVEAVGVRADVRVVADARSGPEPLFLSGQWWLGVPWVPSSCTAMR